MIKNNRLIIAKAKKNLSVAATAELIAEKSESTVDSVDRISFVLKDPDSGCLFRIVKSSNGNFLVSDAFVFFWKSKAGFRRNLRNRKYRVNNKRRLSEKRKERYRRNADEERRSARERAHVRRSGAKGFTWDEFEELCYVVGDKCVCCGKIPQEGLQPDHIIPHSKGGKNTIDNIQPLCPTCNKVKGTKSEDWLTPFLEKQQKEIENAEFENH